jgi:hypothetical protein
MAAQSILADFFADSRFYIITKQRGKNLGGPDGYRDRE